MHPHDKKLYDELLRILPTNGGIIEFLRTFDFNSYHFAGEKLKDLQNLSVLWNGAEYEFVDEELKELLKILKVKTKKFLLNVFGNVYPAEAQGFYKVLREFDNGAKNEKYGEIVAELHNDANELVKAREDVINKYLEKSNKQQPFYKSLQSWAAIFTIGVPILMFAFWLGGHWNDTNSEKTNNLKIQTENDKQKISELNSTISDLKTAITKLENSNYLLKISNKKLEDANFILNKQVNELGAELTKLSNNQEYLTNLSINLSAYISEYNKISAYDVDTGGHYSTALEKEGYYDKVRKANKLREIIFGIAKELDLKELQKIFAPR